MDELSCFISLTCLAWIVMTGIDVSDGIPIPSCSELEELQQNLTYIISSMNSTDDHQLTRLRDDKQNIERIQQVACVKNVDFRNLTEEKLMTILFMSDSRSDIVRQMVNPNTGLTRNQLKSLLIILVQNSVTQNPETASLAVPLFAAHIRQLGGIRRVTVDKIRFLNSSFVTLVPIQDIGRMSNAVFLHLMSLFHKQQDWFLRNHISNDGHDGGQYNNSQYNNQSYNQYNTQYDGQYNTQYDGQYNTQYDGQYSNQHDGQYNTQYDGQFSNQHDGQYNTQYDGQFSNQHDGQYNTQYDGQFSNQHDGQYNTQYDGQYNSQYNNQSSYYGQHWNGSENYHQDMSPFQKLLMGGGLNTSHYFNGIEWQGYNLTHIQNGSEWLPEAGVAFNKTHFWDDQTGMWIEHDLAQYWNGEMSPAFNLTHFWNGSMWQSYDFDTFFGLNSGHHDGHHWNGTHGSDYYQDGSQHHGPGGRPQQDLNPNAIVIYMLMQDPARLKAICSRAYRLPNRLMVNSTVSLHLLMCAPVKACKNFPTEMVQNNLQYLGKLPWGCGKQKLGEYDEIFTKMMNNAKQYLPSAAICGRYIVQKAIEPGYSTSVNLTAEDGVMSLQMMTFCLPDNNLIQVADAAGCEKAMGAVTEGVFNEKVAKHIVSNCIEMPDDLSTLNCSIIESKYKLKLTSARLNFYKQLDPNVLCDPLCVQLFKENSPESVSNYLTRQCFAKSDVQLTSEVVGSMGAMVTELPVDRFKTIDAADLVENLDEIKKSFSGKGGKMKKKRIVMQQIAKKMKESGNLASVTDSKEIMQQVSLKDLKAAVTTNIEESLGLTGNKTIELTPSQNRWAMKQIMKTQQANNFSANDLRGKKSLVKGFLSSDIQSMSEGEQTDTMDKAVVMCEQTNWPLKPLKAINRDLIVGALTTRDSNSPMSSLLTGDVSALGCECLMHFKAGELSKMPADVCSSICQKVGHCSRFRCLNPVHRKSFTQACLKCQGLRGTVFTDATLDAMGPSLLPHLTPAQVRSMVNSDVLMYSLQYLPHMCMPQAFRNVYAAKMMAVIGRDGSSYTWDVLQLLQNGILLLDSTVLNQINKANILDMAAELVAGLAPKDEELKDQQECCERWLSEADLENLRARKKNVLLAIKDAVIASFQTSRRRRRSTGSWTCENIQLIESAFTTVSEEEINNMEDGEFADCLSDIGALTWSDSMKTVLLDKAFSALNVSLCNMTDDQLQSLGDISQAIPAEDMDCLRLNVTDTVVSLGAVSGWDQAQLESLAEQYIEDNDATDLSAVTSPDIGAMGSILCGFNGSQILDIPLDVMAGSGAQIGDLSDCGTDQLTAFKTLAVSGSYGAVVNWTAAETSELNFVIAGLTGDEIEDLSLGAIEGLSDEVIPKIPSDVLSEMSVDQLESFSEVQSVAITDTQLAAMSSEQQFVVRLPEEEGDTAIPNIGTTIKAVIFVVLIAVVVSSL